MLCDYQKHGHIANGYQTWVCTHLSFGVETFIELEVLGTFGGQGSREISCPILLLGWKFHKVASFQCHCPWQQTFSFWKKHAQSL